MAYFLGLVTKFWRCVLLDSDNGNSLRIKIADLENRYDNFAKDEDKRLLRWLIRPADLELFDIFFRVQEEKTANITDLFMTFDVPFVSMESYPRDLSTSLEEQHEYIRPNTAQEKIEAEWRCPPPEAW